MAGRRKSGHAWCALFFFAVNVSLSNESFADYLLYGRFYLPTGRLDALYSLRITPTLQALVAAISDRPSNVPAGMRAARGGDASNVMLSLQHDVGKWCTEYTWSAEDAMWGVRVLHNFGKIGAPVDTSDDGERNPSSSSGNLKRVDEEDAVNGGLRGRVSAGAEFYFSAKERSAGGQSQYVLFPRNIANVLSIQCPPVFVSRHYQMPLHRRSKSRHRPRRFR